MKKIVNVSLVACAIALAVAGCKGNNSGGSADTAKSDTAKSDSSVSIKTKTDTTLKTNSVAATDTSKARVDTVSKTVIKHTEVKKSVEKKH